MEKILYSSLRQSSWCELMRADSSVDPSWCVWVRSTQWHKYYLSAQHKPLLIVLCYYHSINIPVQIKKFWLFLEWKTKLHTYVLKDDGYSILDLPFHVMVNFSWTGGNTFYIDFHLTFQLAQGISIFMFQTFYYYFSSPNKKCSTWKEKTTCRWLKSLIINYKGCKIPIGN